VVTITEEERHAGERPSVDLLVLASVSDITAGGPAGEVDLRSFSRSILAEAAHRFSPTAPPAKPWRGTASGSLLGGTNSSMGDQRELVEAFLPLQRAKLFNVQETSDH